MKRTHFYQLFKVGKRSLFYCPSFVSVSLILLVSTRFLFACGDNWLFIGSPQWEIMSITNPATLRVLLTFVEHIGTLEFRSQEACIAGLEAIQHGP